MTTSQSRILESWLSNKKVKRIELWCEALDVELVWSSKVCIWEVWSLYLLDLLELNEQNRNKGQTSENRNVGEIECNSDQLSL